MSIKEYSWKPHIKILFESGGNFDFNYKAINKTYEEYVLNEGDFDERIFLAECKRLRALGPVARRCHLIAALIRALPSQPELEDSGSDNEGDDANSDIGTPTKMCGMGEFADKIQAKRAAGQKYGGSIQHLEPSTPLTGRRYLKSKEIQHNVTPVSTATQSVSRLQTLLAGRQAAPSEALLEIFKYNLLDQEIFHQTLFACCLEIVIYSYNSQRTFPWILEALNLEAYYFYKVIEVIVKVEDGLSRDMVKHLNLIEENILESMAWRSESPLWENIRSSGLPVPTCEDVCLPGQLDDNVSTVSCPNPVIKRLTTGIERTITVPNQSPISSVSERFHSPVGSSLAKKRLFTDGPTNVIRVKPGQSLLQTTAKTMSINIQIFICFETAIEGENGERYIPISYVSGAGSVIIQAQPGTVKASSQSSPNKQSSLVQSPNRQQQPPQQQQVVTINKDKKPKRTGSLGLFFRKVAKSEKTFTDIMRCYRMQPQAASHVYRSVLLTSKRRRGEESKDRIRSSSTLPVTQPPSAPPTPTHLAGTSSTFEHEDRGDLIKFYNTIYVQKVQNFALKFSSSAQPENLTLSPLPLGKNQPKSPCRRVSEKHSVYIRSLETKEIPRTPTLPLSYCFSRSPAKDLRAINNMIQIDSKKVGKRLLADDAPDGDASPAKQPAPVAKRLQNLIGDRLGQAQD
ncbi:hypothetical protein C0J52_22608 [Blattella germanica]|nr:hypothetical protein C0J52_22608 [Blattella germanica]